MCKIYRIFECLLIAIDQIIIIMFKIFNIVEMFGVCGLVKTSISYSSQVDFQARRRGLHSTSVAFQLTNNIIIQEHTCAYIYVSSIFIVRDK